MSLCLNVRASVSFYVRGMCLTLLSLASLLVSHKRRSSLILVYIVWICHFVRSFGVQNFRTFTVGLSVCLGISVWIFRISMIVVEAKVGIMAYINHYHSLGKFSRWHINILLTFIGKLALTFHANEKSVSIFWDKYFKMSSAEICIQHTKH